MPTHQCGAALSLMGFGISLIIGLWVDNSFVTVVLRGLWVLVLFYVLGCLLSIIGQKVVQENFKNQVKAQEQAQSQPAKNAEYDNAASSEILPEKTPAENAALT